MWDEHLWCLMQREWQSWCERTWKDEITLPLRLCRQNKWQKRKKLCSHRNKIYFKSSQITSAVCGKLSYKKKITSLFIKWQNIRQSSYRRFFVLYRTKFTEPEVNNCFSIIALVLSNYFVNSFCCWNHCYNCSDNSYRDKNLTGLCESITKNFISYFWKM